VWRRAFALLKHTSPCLPPQVWDRGEDASGKRYALVKPLFGHTRSVTSLCAIDDFMVSGGAEGTIRVSARWRLRQRRHIVPSLSVCSLVQVWNVADDWACVKVTQAHRAAISCVFNCCGTVMLLLLPLLDDCVVGV
jgi:hypothetical protein